MSLDDDVSAINFDKCVTVQAGNTVISEPLVNHSTDAFMFMDIIHVKY